MNKGRIDTHHHLLTAQYVEELSKVGVVQSGGIPFPRWQPEDSLAVMDRYGIQMALLSVSSPGLCFGNDTTTRIVGRALNEFAAQSMTRWPDRLGFFATLPLPNVDDALAEIAYALDTLHADGIGLLSNYAGIYLGDSRFDAVFAELDRRAAVVFIHPTVFTSSEIPSARNAGSPIPTMPGFMLEFIFDTTRAVASLVISGTLKRYPHMRFILSHAGGTIPFVANKIVSGVMVTALARPGATDITTPPSPEVMGKVIQTAHEETFAQLQSLYYDTALSANVNALSSLQQLVPASHILLGTDYPFAPEAETPSNLKGIETYAGFSQQEREDIERNNALRLFPRLQR